MARKIGIHNFIKQIGKEALLEALGGRRANAKQNLDHALRNGVFAPCWFLIIYNLGEEQNIPIERYLHLFSWRKKSA